jgi:transposase
LSTNPQPGYFPRSQSLSALWATRPRSSDDLTFKTVALPPYAPELNPIEQCWAKLKTALRQAHARTRRTLDVALKRAQQTITPADAQAWSGVILSSAS